MKPIDQPSRLDLEPPAASARGKCFARSRARSLLGSRMAVTSAGEREIRHEGWFRGRIRMTNRRREPVATFEPSWFGTGRMFPAPPAKWDARGLLGAPLGVPRRRRPRPGRVQPQAVLVPFDHAGRSVGRRTPPSRTRRSRARRVLPAAAHAAAGPLRPYADASVARFGVAPSSPAVPPRHAACRRGPASPRTHRAAAQVDARGFQPSGSGGGGIEFGRGARRWWRSRSRRRRRPAGSLHAVQREHVVPGGPRPAGPCASAAATGCAMAGKLPLGRRRLSSTATPCSR